MTSINYHSILTRRRQGLPSRAVLALFLLLTPAIAPAVVQAQSSPAVDPRASETGSVDGSLLIAGTSARPTDSVRVTVLETGAVSNVDTQGRYAFPDLPPGTYTLIVSGEGYGRLRITDVVVRPGQRLALGQEILPVLQGGDDVVKLEEVVVRARRDDVVQLDPYNVTAAKESYVSPVTVAGKTALPVRQIPNSVSVITQQRIADQNLVTVADALNQTTGVTVISNDSTQSQYYSRGYTLNVQNDGLSSTDSLTGYQQLDLAFYERVEVLRGPAGVLQGSGNLGGVVNLVKKRTTNNFETALSGSIGSWNNYLGQFDVNVPLNTTKTVRGRVVGFAQDRDFFYDRSHDRKLGGYGIVEWDLGPRTTASVSFSVQDDNSDIAYMGLPSISGGGLLNVKRSTNPYPDWNRMEWTTYDYGFDIEHKFESDWIAKVRLNHRDQGLFFKDAFPSSEINPVTNTTNYRRREYDYDYDRNALDIYVSGPVTLFGREHTLLLGYNYDGLETNSGGVEAPALSNIPFGRHDLVPEFWLPYNTFSESKTTQSGFYGQVRISVIDPFTVVAGGRVSDYEAKSRRWTSPATKPVWIPGAKETGEFTPYAGAVYDLTKQISLYGSYSDIFVPQTQKRPDDSTIDPRVGKQYEVGAKGEFFDKKLNVSLAFFDMKDTGRAYALAAPAPPNTYGNEGEVESKGIEFEISGSPFPGYELTAGYTWTTTEYTRDSSREGWKLDTKLPEHSFKFWGTRRFTEGPLDGLSLGLGFIWVSATSIGNEAYWNQYLQSSYSVASALVGYRINKKLTVSLNVNNLFDTTYYTRLSGSNTYNSYGEPRNFTLSARYQF
ncbi:TonB-dependent siderophore receptor [Geminisphaera colitermitum]|uniref:TonB-dependent siderophore receptor n=1 Tax=Geminisphaera colitermitum TaxID=1148786 RepID=UPI000158C8D8|nr:TonB-dependent siderophore receptor [Geminisphaera colitermitum]